MRISFDRYEFLRMDPTIGMLTTLVKCTDELSGKHWYILCDSDGVGGNMNGSAKRFHGWRGTTNNVSREALGLRRVEKIIECKNGKFWVVLSADLRPDEE